MISPAVIEKWNKYCKNINTNHLIVLCEIGEEYKSFCEDLEKLIKSKTKKDLVIKVYNAMQEKSFIVPRKYKTFIEKHKHTIEIMNKYFCLGYFTVYSYDSKGEYRENLSANYFYQYIQEHKEDIETIKAVALKLKTLGFDEIHFGEKLDFTEIEYVLNSEFAFLENMEVTPTYNSPIKYRTNGSCYCLRLYLSGYGSNKTINEHLKNVELNSLIFDPNKLPDEITIESTIGVIQELAEQKKEEREDICDSVDLSISTDDLKNEFERLKKIIDKIDKKKDNPELASILNQMQNILIKLQLFGAEFENQIIDSHASITKETLEKEKRFYLDRRANRYID